MDSWVGTDATLFNLHTLHMMVHEIVLMAPLVALAWYIGRYRTEGRREG